MKFESNNICKLHIYGAFKKALAMHFRAWYNDTLGLDLSWQGNPGSFSDTYRTTIGRPRRTHFGPYCMKGGVTYQLNFRYHVPSRDIQGQPSADQCCILAVHQLLTGHVCKMSCSKSFRSLDTWFTTWRFFHDIFSIIRSCLPNFPSGYLCLASTSKISKEDFRLFHPENIFLQSLRESNKPNFILLYRPIKAFPFFFFFFFSNEEYFSRETFILLLIWKLVLKTRF